MPSLGNVGDLEPADSRSVTRTSFLIFKQYTWLGVHLEWEKTKLGSLQL